MKQFEYVISDPNGIHARPAGQLIAEMKKFNSKVTFACGDKSADGSQLFALMKMRVKQGEKLLVSLDGPDEDAALEAAKVFLAANL